MVPPVDAEVKRDRGAPGPDAVQKVDAGSSALCTCLAKQPKQAFCFKQAVTCTKPADCCGVSSVPFRVAGALTLTETRVLTEANTNTALSFSVTVPSGTPAGESVILQAFAQDAAGNVNASPSLLLPVEQMSWLDCTFWLRRAGLGLPSEAQWEYVAKSGTGLLRYWPREREACKAGKLISACE